MNKSSIEWTDWTSNPLQAYADAHGTGLGNDRGWFCEKVSPGCAHCYSATLNLMRGNHLDFVPANREKVMFRLNESELAEWSRKRLTGPLKGQPFYTGRCFAFDMTDLFGEWVDDLTLFHIFQAMAEAPNLQFQILTKRPERMQDFCKRIAYIAKEDLAHLDAPSCSYWPNEIDDGIFTPRPLPNVWLGCTVENQRWADHRIPILLDTPAAVRFVSAEPLLGPIHFSGPGCAGCYGRGVNPAFGTPCQFCFGLDWIIVGGESGPKHRLFDPAWARSIVAQCKDADVACFVKQLGGARPGNRLEDLPEDLRVREYPR